MADAPSDDSGEVVSEEVNPPAVPNTVDTEYQTLANGVLSPRHRRLAQLAAEGRPNAAIAKELDYSDSRVSILMKNPYISLEIRRLQDRIFEETIQTRLKSFAEPALNNIHEILTDRTNRVKVSEKADMSKWVVEKLDGKAIQKTDIGENLLGVFLDRLDARKAQQSLPAARDVSPDIEVVPQEATPAAPEDELTAWVRDFCGESS